MNETAKTGYGAVPPEEVERRIAEYRRLGFQRRAEAQVVYQGSDQMCPWPGCGLRIVGINFQLHRMEDSPVRECLLAAWWQGPGLVGRCPGCGRYVLFGMREKLAVTDLTAFPRARLPGDWATKAHLVPRPPAPEHGGQSSCESASN